VFADACRRSGQALELRTHAGYDHGYYFIQSFVEDHLRWHARQLHAGDGCTPGQHTNP
jgi:S-formylglutathione hydrolase